MVEEAEERGRLETTGSSGFETLAGARSSTTGQTLAPAAPAPDPAGGAALAAAEADPGNLSDEHALTLMTAEGDLLDQVTKLADDLRKEVVGDDVTYVVNRNINFTNVCYVGCRFCAFAQRRTDADAYSLSLDQVADRAEEAWELGATEVCMQGGIDPELAGTAYFDLAAAVKTARAGHARARVLPDGDRERVEPHRALLRGLPDQGARVRAWTPSREPRRRSSTTRSGGC